LVVLDLNIPTPAVQVKCNFNHFETVRKIIM